jgi:hypothetical protein
LLSLQFHHNVLVRGRHACDCFSQMGSPAVRSVKRFKLTVDKDPLADLALEVATRDELEEWRDRLVPGLSLAQPLVQSMHCIPVKSFPSVHPSCRTRNRSASIASSISRGSGHRQALVVHQFMGPSTL